MKRIACVIDTISRNAGGLSSSVRGLMRTMQQQGDAMRFFSVADQYSHEDAWTEFDCFMAQCRGPRKFGYAPTMDLALELYDPDIVHCHGLWTYSTQAAINWRRNTGKPVIIHPHGMLDPWALKHNQWKKFLARMFYERRNLTNASCIRALCVSEMESIRALGLKTPVCVIPNAIDLPGPAKDDVGVIHPGRKLLLYLGRLHPKKGINLLIEAWAQMQQEASFAEWTLVIAGWDQVGHEDALKRQASKAGLAWTDLQTLPDSETRLQTGLEHPPPLVFTGPVFGKNKERLYRACEAFALPSYSEGLPMVVLEAWAYGKPVIMTPMCNLPEGFEAQAALRIETNAASISEVLKTMVDSSAAERREMGARGQSLIQTKFNWQLVANQMREVNFWLVRGGPPPDTVFLW
jgi:glycosyltransferase involved in cell wall biosynthesis